MSLAADGDGSSTEALRFVQDFCGRKFPVDIKTFSKDSCLLNLMGTAGLTCLHDLFTSNRGLFG